MFSPGKFFIDLAGTGITIAVIFLITVLPDMIETMVSGLV